MEPFHQLPNLTELHLGVNYHLPETTSPLLHSPLSQIKSLHLDLFKPLDSPLSVESFIETLSQLFPCVERMSVRHGDVAFLRDLVGVLDRFSMLQRCRLFTGEDEYRLLGRHKENVQQQEIQEENKRYSQSRIRLMPVPRPKGVEKFDFVWSPESGLVKDTKEIILT